MSSIDNLKRRSARYTAKEEETPIERLERRTDRIYAENASGARKAIGYLAGKAYTGTAGIIEGATDMLTAPFNGGESYRNDTVGQFENRLQRRNTPGTALSFAGDVVSGITQQVPYLFSLVGLPMVGTAIAAAGHVGSGIQEGVQTTGNLGGREVAYGLITGSEDTLLDLAMGGGAKAINKLAPQAVKTAGKAAAEGFGKSVGKELIKSFAGEASQEFIEDFSDTALQKWLLQDDTAQFDLKRALYSAAVGGFSGAAVGGAASAIGYKVNSNRGRQIYNAGEADTSVATAKAVLNALNGQQTGIKNDLARIKGMENGLGKVIERINNFKDNRRVSQLIEAIEGDIQAWDALTNDQRNTEAGHQILGELSANYTAMQMSSFVAEVEERIKSAPDADIQSAINQINEEQGTTYTVQDVRENKDGIATELAGRFISDLYTGENTVGGYDRQTDVLEKINSSFAGSEDASATFADYAKAVGLSDFERSQMEQEWSDTYGLSPTDYAIGYATASRMGKYGVDMDTMRDESVQKLPETLRRAAYAAGALQRSETIASKAKAVVKRQSDTRTYTKGNVSMPNNLKESDMDAQQKATVTAARILSSAMDVKIRLVNSVERDGRYYITENGKERDISDWYGETAADGTITVDLNSISRGNNVSMYVLAHEVTHDLRKMANAQFEKLADIVAERYALAGTDFDQLVKDRLNNLEAKRDSKFKAMSYDEKYDYAREEVICDSMQTILNDGEALRMIYEQDKTLFQKIKDFITKMIAKIRAAYDGISGYTGEARLFAEIDGDMKEIEAAFAEAVKAAGQNTTVNEQLSQQGIEVDEQTDTAMFSERDIPKNEAEINIAVQRLSKSLGVNKEEARRWVEQELSAASLILDPKFGIQEGRDYSLLSPNGDRRRSAVQKNSDYPQGTLDFSNICRKRREYTAMMQRLQKAFPDRVFLADDYAKIRQIMVDEGAQVACGLCFVEDRRQNEGMIAQTFINALAAWRNGDTSYRDAAAEKRFADGDKNAEAEILREYNTNQRKAMSMVSKADGFVPNLNDLTTLDGMKELRKDHKTIAEAWEKFNNARGMASSRLLQNESEYQRQILKYGKARVDRINSMGGLRIYSFSDFEEFHIIDLMQAIQDCAAVGLKIQCYTKVPAFARMLMATNAKVNRSLIPAGDLGYHLENGKRVLDYDTVEGIDINDPDYKAVPATHRNVGNILVGINDDQIRTAMLDPFVHYIIPFHTSQTMKVREIKKLAAWNNYKDEQTDKDSAGKSLKHGVNVYKDVIEAAENDGHTIQNEREFVEKFLSVCKEKNWTPRFARFLDKDADGNYTYTEGYYKLLLDFKLFDEQGNIIPQEVVRPEFDVDFVHEVMQRYIDSTEAKDAKTIKNDKIYKRIVNEVVETKKSERNIGYHAGDLGKSIGDDYFGQGYSRGTGHFGFGTYFVGDEEQINDGEYGKRPHEKVDFSKYNLFKPRNAEQGYRLHDALKVVDGYAEELSNEPKSIKDMVHRETEMKRAAKDLILGGEGFEDADEEVLENRKKIDKLISEMPAYYRDKIENDAQDKYDAAQELDTSDEGIKKYLEERYKTGRFYKEIYDTADSYVRSEFEDEKRSREDRKSATLEEWKYRVAEDTVLEYISDQSKKWEKLSNLPFDLYVALGVTVSEDKIKAALKKTAETVSKYNRFQRGNDSAATVFMKELGYEGVDVRGIKGLDNTKYGSVIYDLKGEDLKRKQEIGTAKYSDADRDSSTEKEAEANLKASIRSLKPEYFYEMQDAMKAYYEGKLSKAALDKKQAAHEAKLKLASEKKLLRDYYKKRMEEMRERYSASRAKDVEGRRRTELKDKISKKMNDISKLLLHPTKESHVPSALRSVVAESLNALDASRVDYEKRLANKQAEIDKELAKAEPNQKKLETLRRQLANIEATSVSVRDQLTALSAAYSKIKESDNGEVRNIYSEFIHNRIRSLIDEIGTTPMGELNSRQLKDVYDTYKAILKTINDANKMFRATKYAKVSEAAMQMAEDVRANGRKTGKSISSLEGLKGFVWRNMKPYTFMKTIGGDVAMELFDGLRQGERTWAFDVRDAKRFFDGIADKYDYDKWDFDKEYTFDTMNGKVTMKLGHIMTMYAYSQDEQSVGHLTVGGFALPSNFETTEKVFGKIPVKKRTEDVTPKPVGIDQLETITNTLTAEQKDFIGDMVKYLSETMGAKGNEVSRAMYDFDMFTSKWYFPIKSVNEYLKQDTPEEVGSPMLKNKGFTQERVAGASNPIVVGDFMDMWGSHVSEMAMFHGFVLPVEDFSKVWGYRWKDEMGDLTINNSLRNEIKKAYGQTANEYIDTLLKDLNGGVRMQPGSDLISKGLSLFKKGATFASASVVIQQPTAIIRAMSVIDPKYFADSEALDFKKHGELWEEIIENTGAGIIKDMGFFDVGVGTATSSWIKKRQYNGFKEKIAALAKDSDYRDEILSKGASMADELAWVHLWLACKNEAADKLGKPVDSKEVIDAAAKRFEEVTNQTQVYDSILTRSEYMRSKDTGAKMATAFMAEPTTSVNMLFDAIVNKGIRGKDPKDAARQIGAVAGSLIASSALVSLIYAARSADKDKTYPEKYVESFLSELVENFNPMSMIPIARDILSLMEGYDVNRADMTVYANVINAVRGLSSKTKTPYRKAEDFAGSIAGIFGLPVKNIMRDLRSVGNVATEAIMSAEKTTNAGLGYAAIEGLFGKEYSNQEQLYRAIMSGDKAQYNRVASRYADESTLETALRSVLRQHDERITRAAEAKIDGDMNAFNTIVNTIAAEGKFDKDLIIRAVNSEVNSIKRTA